MSFRRNEFQELPQSLPLFTWSLLWRWVCHEGSAAVPVGTSGFVSFKIHCLHCLFQATVEKHFHWVTVGQLSLCSQRPLLPLGAGNASHKVFPKMVNIGG